MYRLCLCISVSLYYMRHRINDDDDDDVEGDIRVKEFLEDLEKVESVVSTRYQKWRPTGYFCSFQETFCSIEIMLRKNDYDVKQKTTPKSLKMRIMLRSAGAKTIMCSCVQLTFKKWKKVSSQTILNTNTVHGLRSIVLIHFLFKKTYRFRLSEFSNRRRRFVASLNF